MKRYVSSIILKNAQMNGLDIRTLHTNPYVCTSMSDSKLYLYVEIVVEGRLCISNVDLCQRKSKMRLLATILLNCHY